MVQILTPWGRNWTNRRMDPREALFVKLLWPLVLSHMSICQLSFAKTTRSEGLLPCCIATKFHVVHNYNWLCDPTIRQPGFDLPRQQWSLLNRFRTEQGHCGACRRKWWFADTDLCFCGEIQTMSHIVESHLLTKLNGGLSRPHSADEDAVSWLTSYRSWHAYEKKNTLRASIGLNITPWPWNLS